MPKQQLIVLVGLPASGKTTYAKNWVAEDPQHRVRINRDDLRQMMTCGPYDRNIDTFIKNMERNLVKRILSEGIDQNISVIVDDTNLKTTDIKDWWHQRMYHKLPHDPFIEAELIYKRIDTPLEECIRRNNERTVGKVPEETIRKMAQSEYLTCEESEILNIAKNEYESME